MALPQKTMLTSLPQAVIVYYAKASNGNVTIQQCLSVSTPTGTKVRALCNRCGDSYILSDDVLEQFIRTTASLDIIASFCKVHRHEEFSPEHLEVAFAPTPKPYVEVAAVFEERVFKDL